MCKVNINLHTITYIISMFNIWSSSKNCPSARCASAANVVCRNADIFGTKTLSLKYILKKPKLTAVGIRCADHATPSIR
jgi:hypothetical protein